MFDLPQLADVQSRRMRTGRRRVVATLALAILAVPACGDDEPGARDPGNEDDRPAGRLADGEARLDVSGDLRESVTLGLRPDSVYSASPGGMSLSFEDERGNRLGVGGATFTGTRTTSLQLLLTITIGGNEPSLFVSEGGECTVRVDRADATGVDGAFDCADLANEEASIDATGTFSASA